MTGINRRIGKGNNKVLQLSVGDAIAASELTVGDLYLSEISTRAHTYVHKSINLHDRRGVEMGWKIGLPSLKLNNAGVKSKSCGSFKSVAEEALKERKGHDPDIDILKSVNNIYRGYHTAAELMEYSQKHIEQLKDKTGRSIRKDAVVMCVTILKPPADYMTRLSKNQQLDFLSDAEKIFSEIVGADNIKSTAIHFDEQGVHEHIFWEPMTADGRLCAKETHNLQFFAKVNKELPAQLRTLGWEIEDCEMYDAAKKDYLQEKKNAGQSSMAYKAEAERKKQEAKEEFELYSDATCLARLELDNVKNELQEAKSSVTETKKKLTTVQEKTLDLLNQMTRYEQQYSELKVHIDEAESELNILKTAIKQTDKEGERLFGWENWNLRIQSERQKTEKERKFVLLEKFVEQPSIKPLWEKFLKLVNIKSMIITPIRTHREHE